MKRPRKKLVVGIFILVAIFSLCVVKDVQENMRYNQSLRDAKIKYIYFHDQLEDLIEGNTPEFQTIDFGYAFFFSTYIEWDKLYVPRCEENRLPDEVYTNVSDVRTAPARAYRQIRDIYYDCVQQVYFDKGEPDEDMMQRSEEADELLRSLYVEVDLL